MASQQILLSLFYSVKKVILAKKPLKQKFIKEN